MEVALDELAQGGRLAERILGFKPEPIEAPIQQMPLAPPRSTMPGIATGFPAQIVIKRDK
jgi:hypothetical protein